MSQQIITASVLHHVKHLPFTQMKMNVTDDDPLSYSQLTSPFLGSMTCTRPLIP